MSREARPTALRLNCLATVSTLAGVRGGATIAGVMSDEPGPSGMVQVSIGVGAMAAIAAPR
jgi:hypothetical protein